MRSVTVIGWFVGGPQDRLVGPLVGQLVRRRVRALAPEDQGSQNQGQ